MKYTEKNAQIAPSKLYNIMIPSSVNAFPHVSGESSTPSSENVRKIPMKIPVMEFNQNFLRFSKYMTRALKMKTPITAAMPMPKMLESKILPK